MKRTNLSDSIQLAVLERLERGWNGEEFGSGRSYLDGQGLSSGTGYCIGDPDICGDGSGGIDMKGFGYGDGSGCGDLGGYGHAHPSNSAGAVEVLP